jgi:hypothetical protein
MGRCRALETNVGNFERSIVTKRAKYFSCPFARLFCYRTVNFFFEIHELVYKGDLFGSPFLLNDIKKTLQKRELEQAFSC